MPKNVIIQESLDEIKKIHSLSLKYNRQVNECHSERLFELMQKHIVEIEELLNSEDPHAFTEIGDLVILCFEMLIENNISINETLLKCFKRYDVKLNSLLNGLS